MHASNFFALDFVYVNNGPFIRMRLIFGINKLTWPHFPCLNALYALNIADPAQLPMKWGLHSPCQQIDSDFSITSASLQHDRIHSNLSIVRVGRGSDFELIKILGQGQFPYSKHFHCSEDKGQRGQWPKLSYIGKFFLLLSLLICPSTPFEAENPASKLKSQSWGSNPSLKAQIPVSRLKSQSQGSNSSPEAKMLVSRPLGSNFKLGNNICR